MNPVGALPFVAALGFIATGIHRMVALHRMSVLFERRASPEDQKRFLWDYVDFRVVQVWTLFSPEFKKACDMDPELRRARTRAIRILLAIPVVLGGILLVFGWFAVSAAGSAHHSRGVRTRHGTIIDLAPTAVPSAPGLSLRTLPRYSWRT